MKDITAYNMFCPRCGADGFISKTAKSFVCEACHFEYYHNVATAAAGIIEVGDKIILAERKKNPHKGMLDLPGGFIDYDESAEEGLKREIREELNLEVGEMRYLTSFPNIYWYRDVKYNTLDMVFTCTVRDMENIRACDDVADYFVISPHEIRFGQIAFPSTRRGLRYYLKTA